MDHERVERFREKLAGLTVSDHYGLDSPGLTCYLNAVLQVLFMTEGFREQLQHGDGASVDAHLDSLFGELRRSKASTRCVAERLQIANLYEQRDAAEYFERVLRRTSPEASKMFKGELSHTTRCLRCATQSDSRSNFWLLPLAVEDEHAYSVERGLGAFFGGERVCEDNVMFCDRCSKKREAEIDCEMTQSPEVLTLLLKRFTFNHALKRYVKLHCDVDVPRTLMVKSDRYVLYALVHHLGGLTGGHYTADIWSFETGEWYRFNDDVVTMIRESVFEPGTTRLRSRTAYLLMYKKGKPLPEANNQEPGADVGDQDRHQLNGDGRRPTTYLFNGRCVDEQTSRSRQSRSKTQTYEGRHESNRRQQDTGGTSTDDWRTERGGRSSRQQRLKAEEITCEHVGEKLSHSRTRTNRTTDRRGTNRTQGSVSADPQPWR